MEPHTGAQADNYRTLDGRFMGRVFCAFAALALLSLLISVGGKALGRSIATAGHTEDMTPHEIVIGNNVLLVPANAIRFDQARRDGVATRLDLYLRWPEMEGYTDAAREDFNNATGERTILFLSFAEQTMSRDMSGRLDPIYRSLIEEPGSPLGPDLMEYPFAEKTGYLEESLVVASPSAEEPFVARCLSRGSAEEMLAPCERDIHLGENLSLLYRFPRELLQHWPELDTAVMAKAEEFLQTGP